MFDSPNGNETGLPAADLIAQNMISDSLQLDWNPDFKAIWAFLESEDALTSFGRSRVPRVLLTPQSTSALRGA